MDRGPGKLPESLAPVPPWYVIFFFFFFFLLHLQRFVTDPPPVSPERGYKSWCVVCLCFLEGSTLAFDRSQELGLRLKVEVGFPWPPG